MPTFFSRALRALPLVAMLVPATASAQWRYPPIYYPPYPGYRYGPVESDLHIEVKPRDAAVYVDGYYAGVVDDFDGTFQRLHVTPGEHEITIYLRGYRSLHRRLYLEPGRSRLIEGRLEPLAQGEAQEPEPVPSEPRDRDRYGYGPGGRRDPFPGRRPMPDDPRGRPDAPGDRPEDPRNRPEAPRDRSDEPRDRQAPPAEPSRYGTVSIRIQPAGATLLIDGEHWDGPTDDERLIVQLTPGHHKIEAEKDGYRRFVTEIDVSVNRTANVNINLSRER